MLKRTFGQRSSLGKQARRGVKKLQILASNAGQIRSVKNLSPGQLTKYMATGQARNQPGKPGVATSFLVGAEIF